MRKYEVQHPLLKKYIKFFWEIRMGKVQLNHRLIPQRNINLRFNLSDTPHYVSFGNKELLLEKVFFSGLQDHFMNASLKLNGEVHLLGICFLPDGFFPFLKIPVSEFKNQILGADEIGFKLADIISEQLKEASGWKKRLAILEQEFLSLLLENNPPPDQFRKLFSTWQENDNSLQIADFCRQNNVSLRKLERLFNKNVGVSANTFNTLNRFHISMNKLIYKDYSKLSDIAYGGDYFDQMHFIKEFKRYAGNTPKKFLLQKNSILQIGELR